MSWSGIGPDSGRCGVYKTEMLTTLRILDYSRSATLRSYAGDTSLPGGKVDLEDRTIEETAVSGGLSWLLFDGVELEL